jgi:pyruvate dehydrogenase E2 component (dihydrolipoamide acetyltransferase)
MGVELSGLKGSGPGGRVIAADVEEAAATAAAAPQPSTSASAPSSGMTFAPGAAYDDVPHTNMRKVIAKRLTESKQTVPHYYLSIECQLDELVR